MKELEKTKRISIVSTLFILAVLIKDQKTRMHLLLKARSKNYLMITILSP